jgi:excisionase family DNA binding protein
MSNELETVSVQEAAHMLNTSVRCVRDWIKNGCIPSMKGAGNRRLIPRSAIGALRSNPRPSNRKLPSLHERYVHGLRVPDGFDLITTYKELMEYTRAFANSDLKFLLLVGSPGSGKSQQLLHDLAQHKHRWIDNHAATLGLYCSVYEAENSPVVMDDINHFFKNPIACSLMKALTQTNRVRSVSWESTTKALEQRRVPRQFTTSSPICILANKWDGTDPDMAAIQDRSTPVAFYPSAEAIHERVRELKWCDVTVWRFCGQNLAKIPQPSMREYYLGMTYKKAGMNWREKLLKIWESQWAATFS